MNAIQHKEEIQESYTLETGEWTKKSFFRDLLIKQDIDHCYLALNLDKDMSYIESYDSFSCPWEAKFSIDGFEHKASLKLLDYTMKRCAVEMLFRIRNDRNYNTWYHSAGYISRDARDNEVCNLRWADWISSDFGRKPANVISVAKYMVENGESLDGIFPTSYWSDNSKCIVSRLEVPDMGIEWRISREGDLSQNKWTRYLTHKRDDDKEDIGYINFYSHPIFADFDYPKELDSSYDLSYKEFDSVSDGIYYINENKQLQTNQ